MTKLEVTQSKVLGRLSSKINYNKITLIRASSGTGFSKKHEGVLHFTVDQKLSLNPCKSTSSEITF